MKLDPNLPPGDNFPVLSLFKLTLPSGKEIASKQLVEGYRQIGVFDTCPANGGMMFRCPNIGGLTPNTHYSRCELREMRKPEGSANAPENNWTGADGGTLRARLRVDHVSTTGDPAKAGRCIIGQIHGPSSEVIRLYFDKAPRERAGVIYAGLDSVDNEGTKTSNIAEGIVLGARFNYEIMLTKNRLLVHIRMPNGSMRKFWSKIDERYEGLPLHFKAGVYNQNNTGEPDDYAQVTFFRLGVSHP